MTLTLPAPLNTQMSWVGPSFEITRFGSVAPALGLRFDAGTVDGHCSLLLGGATLRYVAWVAATAVRSKTAAAAVPSLGMPTPVPPGGNPETTILRQVPPLI